MPALDFSTEWYDISDAEVSIEANSCDDTHIIRINDNPPEIILRHDQSLALVIERAKIWEYELVDKNPEQTPTAP